MTRALVLFVGVLGAGLPLWALGTYPVEDSFSRVLVAVILAGLVVGVFGLARRAAAIDRRLSELRGIGDEVSAAKLEESTPALWRLVHARLRGQRPSLERGEAVTRYLVGSLVLVGLLGTFVGLVDALVGAREVLGASNDVDALRSALLAPMKGLSRAFGTSVAGISASAMLGLASVVVRRSELRVLERVEDLVAGPLKAETTDARQLAAFEGLGAALARGLASAAEGSDALFERAVTNASAVLEERAAALAKLFEDAAKERREAEQAWQTSFAEQTRSLLATLEASLEKQAERWDAGASALAKADAALERFLEEQREGDRALAGELKAFLVEQREGERALAGELKSVLAEQREGEQALVAELKGAFETQLEGQRESAEGLITELKGFLGEQREGERALAGELKGFLSEQREGEQALVGELKAFLAEEREGEQALVGELKAFLAEQREGERALVEALRAFVEEQKESDRAALERVQAFLEESRGADRALVEDMRAFLRDEKGQALAFSDDIRGQLEGWLTQAAERDQARDEARIALEETLTKERQELSSQVTTHLEAYASAVREQVADIARSLSDGADALVAGGVELGALAERFSSAVESYKDATREWMDRLGALELNVSTGGADTERERFGAYLDQTREVFERSLEVQRELFSGLKASPREPEEERLEDPQEEQQQEREQEQGQAAVTEDVVADEAQVKQPTAEA